jgi:hypothetical protein
MYIRNPSTLPVATVAFAGKYTPQIKVAAA